MNPSVAYLVSDFGAFRTQNGGAAWTALNNSLSDPLTLQTLGQVLVDRFDRRTIYAGGRMGLADPAWKMLTGAPAPLWTRLQHTACSTVGDACFLTVPPTATLRSVSGRLTLDPLVSGNWISLVETADINNTQALLDERSRTDPRNVSVAALQSVRIWTALNPSASRSPFAYRIQLVPDAARTMVISSTNTLGQPGPSASRRAATTSSATTRSRAVQPRTRAESGPASPPRT